MNLFSKQRYILLFDNDDYILSYALHICVREYIYIYIYMYLLKYIFVYVCVCMYVYIYIYICFIK